MVLEPAFGWPVAGYLILSAIAGACALLGAAFAQSEEAGARRAGRAGLRLALVSLVAGAACLISDLEQPARFWRILTEANPDSVIAIGARVLCGLGLAVGFALVLSRGPADAPRGAAFAFFHQLAMLLGVALLVYPPFVLRQGEGAALWQSPWLVPLLSLGGAHAGASVFSLLSPGGRRAGPIGADPRFRAAEMHLILLSSGAAFLFARAQGSGGVLDTLRQPGWEGFLAFAGAGLLLPFVLSWIPAAGRALVALRALLVLFGASALRAWVLFEGQGVSLLDELHRIKETMS